MDDTKAADQQPDAAPEIVDETSGPFVGAWQRLISTTNWEKGRIIYEWRESLFLAGAPPRHYSDEAWSRRVGHVSSQHVGRLRRVYERFGKVREDYQGLYWSHFTAAIDWNDAEMWLEGAVQNGWSVSQMRLGRWEAQGAPQDRKPRDADIVAAELDEDTSPVDQGAATSAKRSAVRDPAADTDVFDDALDAEPSDAPLADGPVDGADKGAGEADATRPFADLKTLPDDLAAAMEACKLAILRHKLAGWAETSREDVLASLEALKQLALAPS